MKRGLLLDNVQIGERVPEESIAKLVAMRASCVGTLWTAGTHHERDVYERCEAVLDHPFYLVRVGGHRQTADEWRRDAGFAISDLSVVDIERVVLTFGNEPNLEGWGDCPEEYGRVYREVNGAFGGVVAFACPSLGVPSWGGWLETALRAAGYEIYRKRSAKVPAMVANVYAHLVGTAVDLAELCERLYIGEVNELGLHGAARRTWLAAAFDSLERAGAEAAVVFIAGGKSGGAWDEGYIVTGEEIEGLGALKSSSAAEFDTKEEDGTPVGTEVDPSPIGDLRPAVVADTKEAGEAGAMKEEVVEEEVMEEEVRRRVAGWAHLFGPAACAEELRVSLVAGLMAVESGGRAGAVSPMNYDLEGRPIGRAQGLMQVMPWHFGQAVGADGELSAAQGRYCRQPWRNIAEGVLILGRALEQWEEEAAVVAAYFGAIDGEGNITDAADATGTQGTRYVEMVMAAAEEFRFLDAVPWAELPAWTSSDLSFDQCQYGETWPEVAANLLGVANDALETGRAVRDAVLAGVNLWGTR